MKNLKIKFSCKDSHKQEYYSTLRSRVDQYFTDNGISRFGNFEMALKTVILLSAFILPFSYILLTDLPWYYNMLIWIVIGFAQAGIGMSVMHDANHGAYSSNDTINTLAGHSLTLIGGSVFNWKLQHNLLHHTYTNIAFVDDDIEDRLILRFSPHTKVSWIHRFQWLYAFVLYGILTLYWVTLKDFIQFYKYKRENVNKASAEENQISILFMAITKLLYFFIFIVLPIFILKKFWVTYLIGYLCMHYVAGMILTIVFQMAHTVDDTAHPLPDEINQIENTWAIHQMNTTANFSPGNKILSWFVGGLNYQIEHHLFPTICHVHYPRIAPIVKATAEEFGIPYLENESLSKAFGSHVNTLKRFGG